MLVFHGEGNGGFCKSGLMTYWSFERSMRRAEAQVYSLVGATGALYALRKRLYSEIPPDTILDDVVIPLKIAQKGYRIAFEECAKAYDYVAGSAEEEWVRKTRTLAGNFQILFRPREMAFPLFSKITFQYISHKALRLLVPFLLPVIFISSAFLEGFWYELFFTVQLVVYLFALTGFVLERHGIKITCFHIPYTFLYLNLAVFKGLFSYFTESKKAAWSRVREIELARGSCFLVLLDALLFNLAILLSFCIRLPMGLEESNFRAYEKMFLFFLLVPILVNEAIGLYKIEWSKSRIEDFLLVFKASFFSCMLSIAICFFVRERLETFAFPTSVFFFSFFINLFLLGSWRYYVKRRYEKGISERRPGRRLLLVGSAGITKAVLKKIEISGSMRDRFIGYLAKNAKKCGNRPPGNPLTLLGEKENLEEVLSSHTIDEVFLNARDLEPEDISKAILTCRRSAIEFYIIPNLLDMIKSVGEISMLNYTPFISFGWPEIEGASCLLKRLFDLVAASVIFAFLSPLLMLQSIRIAFRRKAFPFCLNRIVGRRRKEIHVIRLKDFPPGKSPKQESSRVEAGHPGPTLVDLTNILLLLLSVIKGDMSLVGPGIVNAPLSAEPDHFEKIIFHVKPGITGLAQICGIHEAGSYQCVLLNNYYIRKYSLILDFKILSRFLFRLLGGSRRKNHDTKLVTR
jgi:lipopolysaccharide/colanic/teichoic acid biosynthesis glycosyltransferase